MKRFFDEVSEVLWAINIALFICFISIVLVIDNIITKITYLIKSKL